MIGLCPTLFIDRSLSRHAHAMLPGLARRSAEAGLGVGLMLSLIVPLNYLASQSTLEWDHAYFRTTRPGTATTALIQTLTEPVEVTLFFQPGNDVGRRCGHADEQRHRQPVERRQIDQALDPETAKAVKIRDNGFVSFEQGDSSRSSSWNQLERAKKDSAHSMDRTQAPVKLTKDQQTLYLFSGHGEANYKERENPLRSIQEFKRAWKTPTLRSRASICGGSGVAVPDDAAVIVIASPETEPLQEEIRTLIEYVDRGGSLFILKDPGDAKLTHF